MLVIVADDHALVRESISDAVAGLNYHNEPIEIATAASYGELLTLKRDDCPPKLVLVDYNMPGVDGFEGVRRVVSAFTGVPVVVISGTEGSQTLARGCLDVGASGFIPKTVSMASLRNALRVVLDGEKYVHAVALTPPAANTPAPSGASALPRFSEREQQIIEALIAGGTNKEIARKLDLQEMTVKTHVRNIYRKIGVANRAGAVRKILEARVSPGP